MARSGALAAVPIAGEATVCIHRRQRPGGNLTETKPKLYGRNVLRCQANPLHAQ